MRKQFDELKLTGRLPSPPGVGMRILRLTQTDDFSQDDLAQAIKSDPALSGKVLKMSNSARTASVTPVSTVNEAVVRLGVRTVRNVALSFSLVSAYQLGSCENFDFERFWSYSLARAVSAQELSQRLRRGNPQEAYLCGLLADIGRLALATVHPMKYSQIIADCHEKSSSDLAEAERKAFEIDHRDVGDALLRDWGLPASQARAVAAYELGERGMPSNDKSAADFVLLLQIADLLAAEAHDIEKVGVARKKEISDKLEACNAKNIEVGELIKCVLAQWKEWGQALDIKPPGAPKPVVRPESGESNDAIQAAALAASILPTDQQPQHKLRILAVDDDKLSVRLLVRHLETTGSEVRQACNGADALRQALDFKPHIVVSDWMMPEMDGVELTRALRRFESGRRMYVIILTGRDEEERIVEAFDAGIDDYVVKPFNPRVLLARVRAGQRTVSLQERVVEDNRLMEQQVAEMAVLARKLQLASLTDVLTGLPNRRHAMSVLQDEWVRMQETAKPFAAIMVDIDHFKQVNDVHGHDIGDVVLQQTAKVFSDNLREIEVVCRLGGEEFLVICSDTDLEGAMLCAERLRKLVEANHIKNGTFDRNVTVSLGVAEANPGVKNIDELLKAADQAVYESKKGGRNRVSAGSAPIQVG